MRITALVIILCAGILAWYSYPDPPPAVEVKPPEVAEPVASEAQPERLAELEDPVRQSIVRETGKISRPFILVWVMLNSASSSSNQILQSLPVWRLIWWRPKRF